MPLFPKQNANPAPTMEEEYFKLQRDAGMTEYYTGVRPETPKAKSLLRRIQERWGAWRSPVSAQAGEPSSEVGTSGSASPSTFGLGLYALRYERREIINDVRRMMDEEPRCEQSVQMYCEEAVRGGFQVVIRNKSNPRGVPGNRERIAREVAGQVEKALNEELEALAEMLFVEGDLFMQSSFVGEPGVNARLYRCVRMPAISMERLSDNRDLFPDPQRAFEQIDVGLGDTHVAFFPEAAICHARWNHVPGERYGRSGLMTKRRLKRLLEHMEDAQVVRRLMRAPKRNLINVGTAERPAKPAQVVAFKQQNGWTEGGREVFDTDNVMLDMYGDGRVSVTDFGGDGNVSDIADLLHFQDVYANCLPTPAIIMNINAAATDRNVLIAVVERWLKRTKKMTKAITKVVQEVFELSLLMRGILPELVDYEIHFPESTSETPTEAIERILLLRKNTVGEGSTGSPDPMVSKQTAMGLLSEHVAIPNLEEELVLVEKEEKERYEMQKELMQYNVRGQSEGSPNKASPSQPKSKAKT